MLIQLNQNVKLQYFKWWWIKTCPSFLFQWASYLILSMSMLWSRFPAIILIPGEPPFQVGPSSNGGFVTTEHHEQNRPHMCQNWRVCDSRITSTSMVSVRDSHMGYIYNVWNLKYVKKMKWYFMLMPLMGSVLNPGNSSLRPANERRRYKVTASLIGWTQT